MDLSYIAFTCNEMSYINKIAIAIKYDTIK